VILLKDGALLARGPAKLLDDAPLMEKAFFL
jgi:hypothetical protein